MPETFWKEGAQKGKMGLDDLFDLAKKYEPTLRRVLPIKFSKRFTEKTPVAISK